MIVSRYFAGFPCAETFYRELALAITLIVIAGLLIGFVAYKRAAAKRSKMFYLGGAIVITIGVCIAFWKASIPGQCLNDSASEIFNYILRGGGDI